MAQPFTVDEKHRLCGTPFRLDQRAFHRGEGSEPARSPAKVYNVEPRPQIDSLRSPHSCRVQAPPRAFDTRGPARTGGRASLLARLAEGQHVERVHEASRRLDIAVQHAERVAVDVGCQRE